MRHRGDLRARFEVLPHSGRVVQGGRPHSTGVTQAGGVSVLVDEGLVCFHPSHGFQYELEEDLLVPFTKTRPMANDGLATFGGCYLVEKSGTDRVITCPTDDEVEPVDAGLGHVVAHRDRVGRGRFWFGRLIRTGDAHENTSE